MRWLIGIFLLIFVLAALGLGAFYFAKDYPYQKYSGWVNGKTQDRYFSIEGFKPLYLKPSNLEEIPPYKEDYIQLWKEFPLRNSVIPLPTRHPLFMTLPIVEANGSKGMPQFGMILQGPDSREVIRIYALPNRLYQDYSQGQDIFKLPYVRNRILKKNLDEIWKDIFSYRIEPKEKAIDEMIYDLYILHIRSKFLPKETLRYGLIKDGKQAMVELTSGDKDYKTELVLTQESGSIFSYILKTEINSPESMRLRAKFLHSIKFAPVDESIGRLLYTEFKQLNYARQVDSEGMQYLFSAWSQNPESLELLKEMINYLERGPNNKKQLKVFYTYSFKRYGKTFSSNKNVDEQDDPNLSLQRKIEIEEKENREAAEAFNNRPPEVQELTPDEKMNMYLKKAKEKKPAETDDIRVH